MTQWQNLVNNGRVPIWPYPILYDTEREIEADVLVIGGGIAGCWAAISVARKGLKVVIAEKANVTRSGAGGPGCDHWCDAPSNPHSKVDPDEWAKEITGPYQDGIGNQIQCRENYDTLLELEQMGGKIRDIEDEYVGAKGRYDDTKLMFSPRSSPNHATEVVLRVWGTTFKPTLKKECQRLGVKIIDRVMVTSLLTEGGEQGARVIGATGFDNRTGEFIIFKSKAVVLCTGKDSVLWFLNTEQTGYNPLYSRSISGDGIAMAWSAGATLTMMEENYVAGLGHGFKHTWYGGTGDASFENIQTVDTSGKKVPWPIQGWEDGGAMRPTPDVYEAIRTGIKKGEYALPFFGDFPAMPEVERRATWKLMLGEESSTRNIINSYEKAGFDPSKHLLPNFAFLEGTYPQYWRITDMGGLAVDWNLKSSLDGLYVAGDQIFSGDNHALAAATGRYAGRKAADYTQQISAIKISPEQVALEKARVYAPIKRDEGIDWKELQAGIGRVMQYFCSEFKTESLFKMGLDCLNEIEEAFVPRLYALDPHKLMRSIEDLSCLARYQMTLHASLARRASSKALNFYRIDYPEIDPPEWNKFITVKMVNGKAVTGELPIDYWGDMKTNYESHNQDYTGVYQMK